MVSPPPKWGGPKLGGVISGFLLLSLHVFLGRVHGDAEIVPEKKKTREFPPVRKCFLVLVTDASVGRVLGGAEIVPEKNRESFLLSKNVRCCRLRMLLLAEYVPATMLDP